MEDPAIDLNALVAPVVGAAIVGLVAAALVLLVADDRPGAPHRPAPAAPRRPDPRRGRCAHSTASSATHLDKVFALAREVDELSDRSARLDAAGRRAIQRVGLVRFNPFEDTGRQPELRARPDGRDSGSGFIVSSLHSRTGTRVYAKAISDGRSDGALSEEESEALRRALTGSRGASPTDARARDRVAGPA